MTSFPFLDFTRFSGTFKLVFTMLVTKCKTSLPLPWVPRQKSRENTGTISSLQNKNCTVYCRCTSDLTLADRLNAVCFLANMSTSRPGVATTMWALQQLMQTFIQYYFTNQPIFNHFLDREWIPNGYKCCSCSKCSCSCCWDSCYYQIFKVLKLFHFATNCNQTLHTSWWQYYPQLHRVGFSS